MPHHEVFDVVEPADPDAGVDSDTCAPEGEGTAAVCSVWSDPAYDASVPAVYYARVLQNPTCRWNAWQCLRMEPGDRPEACADSEVPRTIRERAWTSPIWVPAVD